MADNNTTPKPRAPRKKPVATQTPAVEKEKTAATKTTATKTTATKTTTATKAPAEEKAVAAPKPRAPRKKPVATQTPAVEQETAATKAPAEEKAVAAPKPRAPRKKPVATQTPAVEQETAATQTPAEEVTIGAQAAADEQVSAAVEVPVQPAAPLSVACDTAAGEAVLPDDDVDIEAVTSRSLSPTRLVLKRFFRSKLSMVGLIVILALFVFSFLGPTLRFLPFIWGEQEKEDTDHAVIIEYTTEVDVTDENGDIVVDEEGNPITVYVVTYTPQVTYLGASSRHLLGTDSMGFDVFSRLMYGGRISLTIGFVVIILETLIGILFGGLAGYFGKWVDQIIMRIVDIFSCIPTMPMLMIVGVALQQQGIADVPRLYIMMAMLTLFGWAGTARLVRGQILSLREQEFMLSAEASGLPVWHKIIKHLLPNVMPQLIVSMTLGLGSIILTEATLGYLNIGLPTAYATWGNMISAAANNTALNYYPALWITPGICIVLAVLAFNFIGDGLRDAFDPKSSK